MSQPQPDTHQTPAGTTPGSSCRSHPGIGTYAALITISIIVVWLAAAAAWAAYNTQGNVPLLFGLLAIAALSALGWLGWRLSALSAEGGVLARGPVVLANGGQAEADGVNQSHALDMLYDAAVGINMLHDLDKLLDHFLGTLMELSGARAGTVRVEEADGLMRLVACRGLTADYGRNRRLVPADHCLSGDLVDSGLLLLRRLAGSSAAIGMELPGLETMSLLSVPIIYHETRLGVYNLVTDGWRVLERPELRNLFVSIGRHLGLAIERARIENHARRVSIMEERTLLANELHDSLAQSLASLRFQVIMAQETIEQSRDRTGLNQIRSIKDGLEQANSQLRELLAHFRTRMDERGLVPAIELMIDKFQKQTGVPVFFQKELTRSDLSPAMEVQVLHIVQEALTNVRKHAGAQFVRVLLRSDQAGRFSVLVEDDGQGIDEKAIKSTPGENIGITIMKERAERIGGALQIESEPGEGTRVELNFDLESRSPRAPLRVTS